MSGKQSQVELRQYLRRGAFPEADGWRWLYGWFRRLPAAAQRLACAYFWPKRPERWRRGLVYKLLGVHIFGALLPTGGIVIRRLTRARMAAYTLEQTSFDGARRFYYRTYVFEFLHLPFLLALVALAAHRASIGRVDLALENTLINLLANIDPILHHRRTRGRIVRLLSRRAGGEYSRAGPRA